VSEGHVRRIERRFAAEKSGGTVHPQLRSFGAFVLFAAGSCVALGCQKASPGAPPAQVSPVTEQAAAPKHDAAWRKRAAVVNVDPGNSVTKRRSESAFSPRTSRASVDSHASSLHVQIAALNHIVSIHEPLVEQQLREMGLEVVGLKQSKRHDPAAFNVFVEDVTYVEEVERKNTWDPLVFTLTPTIHVRVITANDRNTLEAEPITVRSHGPLSPQAAESYGRKLALERIDLGKRLVEWLAGRLTLSHEGSATKPVSQSPRTAPSSG
jgi:hypothetical protein